MPWWEALLLAIVQGTTEWLPVSSSGHLVLAREWMGLEGSVGYILLLHAGTLAAVLWAYRRRLVRLLQGLASWPAAVRKEGWRASAASNPERLVAAWIVVGTLPIVVAGLLLRPFIVQSHESLGNLWLDFLITAALLTRASFVRTHRTTTAMGWRDAVIIGLYQALALLPGVSRSGATLAGAVERRFHWADAADYAFLLSIPALTGAMVLEWRSFGELADVGVTASLLGFVVSGLVGYATIRWLLRFLRSTRPWVFAIYCAGLGLVLAWMRFA